MRYRLMLAFVVILVGACSSGTDPDEDGGGSFTPSTEFQGFFLDDAVEGLQYQVAGGAVKTTDEYGTFTSDAGMEMNFLVDGVSLGTVTEGRTRITPNDFGVAGANIARFVQSLDTTPGEPGIDLAGVDLAGTAINFVQSGSAFAADPLVQQAVAAAASAGANGVLISESAALAALAAGTSSILQASDLENVALFPVVAGANNEPCFVRFRDDGTGQNICEDDIVADPSGAAVEFTWMIDNSTAVVEFDFGAGVEERVTLQRLGTTGNRISAQVTSERVQNCNPNVEPCIEGEVQTLITALPITGGDFSGKTISFVGPGGSGTATFNANGAGTLSDMQGTEDFVWSVGSTFNNVLVLQGTGTPGDVMLYHELILIEGTASGGTFAALFGEVTDTNSDGVVDESEMTNTGEYEAVELLASTEV